MARCRGCGQEIEWIKMKTGKSMPVDPERIMYWEDENGDETLVTLRHSRQEISRRLPGTDTYHISRPARTQAISDGEDGKDERQMDQGNPAEDAA